MAMPPGTAGSVCNSRCAVQTQHCITGAAGHSLQDIPLLAPQYAAATSARCAPHPNNTVQRQRRRPTAPKNNRMHSMVGGSTQSTLTSRRILQLFPHKGCQHERNQREGLCNKPANTTKGHMVSAIRLTAATAAVLLQTPLSML